MADIYSITMIELHDLNGRSLDFGPLPGFVYVVRGVDAVNGELVNELQLHGSDGQIVWANSWAGTVGFDYASYRGHYVVENPDLMHLESSTSVDVTVWGYRLTAP